MYFRNKFSVQNYKFSKIIKNHFLEFLSKPLMIFNKRRNLKFHFDLFHGKGNLDLAINCLDKENKDDFKFLWRMRHFLILTTCLYAELKY